MDALVLAAGFGSRLRDAEPCKPLARIDGRTLLEIGITQLARAGATRVRVATGYQAAEVEQTLPGIAQRAGVTVEARRVADHTRPNGHSVLAGAEGFTGSFLLAMADHILSDAIYAALTKEPPPAGGVVLAVDRRIDHPLIDPDDATWVDAAEDGRIRHIGKTLDTFGAVDCGAFHATPALLDAIRAAIAGGKPGSLSDGMQVLADASMAWTADVGSAWWIDVDDLADPCSRQDAYRSPCICGAPHRPSGDGHQAGGAVRPRVLLDVTRSVGRRWRGRTASGIDRVCDAYAEHLGESAHAVLQIRGNALVLDDAASRALFTVLDAPTQVFRREFTRLIVNPARSASCLPAVGDAFYLNVGHSGFDANAHWNWIARQGLSPLYLLHDLIPITHPHVTTPRKTARHRERVVRALSGGTGLIANSYATADALRDFAASENLPLPPLLVAPIAASLPSARAPVADQERPLFVSVGTIEKRKNHILLLQVWTLLIARMGEAAPRLVIAGNWGKGGGPVREALRRDPRLARFVEIRCGLDDNQIADLVAGARAALLPTSAEGFGMPLIEALSLEVPVIANDLPSLREIGQDIPHFLSGDDPGAWAAAIAEMCGDGPDRPRQLAMMRQFRAPSWSTHFAALDLWMKDLRRSARPATTLRLDHAGVRRDPTNYRSAGRPPIPGREASC